MEVIVIKFKHAARNFEEVRIEQKGIGDLFTIGQAGIGASQSNR